MSEKLQIINEFFVYSIPIDVKKPFDEFMKDLNQIKHMVNVNSEILICPSYDSYAESLRLCFYEKREENDTEYKIRMENEQYIEKIREKREYDEYLRLRNKFEPQYHHHMKNYMNELKEKIDYFMKDIESH